MAKTGKHKGYVRIISGEWRSRRIPVADVPGLRPTGDRVRETLFNWLQTYLPGSRCLDLFAGTGILGIEAVSRGAASAVLLEKHHVAVAAMEKIVASLEAASIEVLQANALTYLGGARERKYDIVFIDPPFDVNIQEEVMNLLAENELLSAGAIVYVESAVKQQPPEAPVGWQPLQNKTIGEVRSQLFRFT